MPADVAVAHPTDRLNAKGNPPSRRSILAGMDARENGEDLSPVSNTDAILRGRRPGTSGSQTSSQNNDQRRKSSISSSQQKGSANGALAVPEEQSFPNGSSIRRRTSNLSNQTDAQDDSDKRSITSRLSSRGVISNILRKNSRSSSAEPDNQEDSPKGGKGRKASNSSRRMSLRMPVIGRSRSSSNSGPATASSAGAAAASASSQEEAPPVPPVPQSHLNGNGKEDEHSNGYVQNGSVAVEKEQGTGKEPVPTHPQEKQKANGTHEEPKEESKEQDQGLLGGAYAAVTGAGAAAGGAAAALASKVTGNEVDDGKPEHKGKSGGGEDSDEEFHDAQLADITEHEEDDHSNQQHHHQHQHRHRGLSESDATSLRDGAQPGSHAGVRAGAGAAAGAAAGYGAARSGSPEPVSPTKSQSPSNLKGTANYKKRSGSTPVGDGSTNTPSDAKAKKETPVYVREKAARVAKLTYDDVKMDESEMKEDISVARGALHLFLNSRMFEAEEIIAKYADRKLYYALGDALIAVIKGFMTFEPEDLAKAISYCKDSLTIASLLRKPTNSVANFGRFVRGTGQSPSGMNSMDNVQRHAELVYAESLLLKAVMGILYSGDFFGFVSEALNMRNAYGIYRSLSKYVEWADEQAQKKKGAKRDETIDEDFRSGVFLGNGLISMILGLLPGKVLKIMEVFGYSGDTQWALKTLARAGEWSHDRKQLEPAMPVEKEGIRRQICDMGILLYHLVISTFIPVTGVDVEFADKVLHYNLERYPQGVFFLYFSGRLYSTQALAEKAIVQYRQARDIQREYVQLQHICYWDMSLCHMSVAQWEEAYDCFELLFRDSNWSKCVYSYGRAANLMQSGKDTQRASDLFHKVPSLMQRIAGKSIPMEKYCARKAKKFIKQKRLLLPAIEFSYIYHCLTNAPRYALCDNQLVDISDALAELNEVEDPSSYYSGADEYWDDYCLAHFLRGVTLRYIAFPEKHAKIDPVESPIPPNEASQQAEISLRNVIESSHRLALDHYLCYFAHYELGRLYANRGDSEPAREEFNKIMSGKTLEDKGRKGKYSMQNMCTLRTNGALAVL